MLVPKTGTVEDLIEALIKKAHISSEDEGGRIRVYETSSNRFYREPVREHPVMNLNDFTQLYAERVPQDEAVAEDGNFIQVFHFQNDVSRFHGVPFKFLLIEVSYPPNWLRVCETKNDPGREICGYEEAIGKANWNQRQEL